MWYLPTLRAALATLFEIVRDELQATLRVKWRQPQFRGVLALSVGAAVALMVVLSTGPDDDAVTESRAAVFTKEGSLFGQGVGEATPTSEVGAAEAKGDLARLAAVPDRDPMAMGQVLVGFSPARAQAAVRAGLFSDDLTERRVATLAAPFVSDPLALLPRLLEQGRSKDARVSPPAVAAVHSICEKLSLEALWAQEHVRADVEALKPALNLLAKDTAGRADLRVAAQMCLDRIDAMDPSRPSTSAGAK